MRTCICSMLALLPLLFACASSPSQPEGVRYVSLVELGGEPEGDSPDVRPIDGLDGTSPTEGEFDFYVWVINATGASAKFSVQVEDDRSTRDIWSDSSLAQSISLGLHEGGLDEALDNKNASAIAVIRAHGDSVKLIVNGTSHAIASEFPEERRLWIVTLTSNGATVTLSDMH